jgi:hypothetical protein
MLELVIRSKQRATQARRAVRDELRERGLGDDDVRVLELVVAELIGTLQETQMASPVVITVDTFPRLHSVRVRGIRNAELADDPFHLRDRILQRLTIAFGQRRNADGTTDLWAEVPRATELRAGDR